MEKNNFRALLRRTVAVPILALVVLASVFAWEIKSLRGSMQWVDHTGQVISANWELMKLTIDMESGLRGFLSTGREEFLQPYNEANRDIDSKFATLNQLVSDNPDQQARLADIRSRSEEWRLYAARTIELRGSGRDVYGEAGNYETSLQGKQLMDSLRAEDGAFQGVEERLRNARVQSARDTSRLVTIASVLLSLGIAGFLALFTRGQIRLLAANFQESADIAEKRAEALREQSEMLRLQVAALDAAANSIVMTDAKGTIQWVNPAFTKLTGYSAEEAIGQNPRVLKSGKHDDQFYKNMWHAVLSGSMWRGEVINRRKDASLYVEEMTITPVRSDDGSICNFLAVKEDITERKRAEEALREQAELLDIAHDTILVRDLDGTIRFWNDGGEKMYGYSKQQAVGRIAHELLRTVFPKPQAEIEAEILQVGRWEGDLIHTAEDGARIVVASRWVAQRDKSGQACGVMEINNDITDRKQAEQRMAYLASFPELNPNSIFEADLEGKVTYSNPEALKQFPTLRESGAGHPLLKDWPNVIAALQAGAKHSTVREVETDGLVLLQIIHYFPELRVVRAYFADITERKRAEEALRVSEQRWATTLQSIGDAVISTDAAGNIDFMNDVAQRLTGWSLPEVKGHTMSAVFDIVQEVTRIKPESPVDKVIRLGKVVGLANHTVLIHRDGTEIPIEDSAAPIRDGKGQIEGVVLVFHDCLEQRKIEMALRNSERLATTGRLAATIAHEIHNPLDAVGNLLYLIGQGTQEDLTQEYASMASSELVRVTQMTQQMLSFQREAAKPVLVNIGEILDSVAALYERKIQTAGIRLERQVEFDGQILALPGELRQIFANLVSNAIEAVGSRRGTITLRAYASRDWQRGLPGLRVVVADNGPGIPAGVRSKIFEPFFTTKGESGTGLGLWIASDILRKYDGTIRLRSSTQAHHSGTCFTVFLPLEISSDLPVRS
jgi:PAS domain S-box-containing protein